MNRLGRATAVFAWALATIVAPCAYAKAQRQGLRVLVFSKTAGFRHDSIPDGIEAIMKLGRERGWQVQATEDAAQFSDEGLANFDVTVWLMTSRDVLNDEEQGAFERFIRKGKGLASIHEGTDTEYDWPWYGQLIGGTYFASHPPVQEAKLVIEDRNHPATVGLPPKWVHTDEYYNFRASPRAHVAVLLSVDERSYDAGPAAMAMDHPISWCRYFDGGRMFHTALGHTKESYTETNFLSHMAGGIEWAGGRFSLTGVPDRSIVILEEFDAVHPPGIWDIHHHPSSFRYEVRKDALRMLDQTVGYASPNQHLTRRKLPIDSSRPYVVESKVIINVNGTEPDPSSFCYNINIGGPDGDLGPISTWSIPIDYHHQWPPSVMKFMGFSNGVFAQIGERPLPWCEQNVEYEYRLSVNATLAGKFKPKTVALTVRQAGVLKESADVDYAAFPYQPGNGAPVRLGVNTHGGNWMLRNLRVYYLPTEQQR